MSQDMMTQLRGLREALPDDTPQNQGIREDLLLEARRLMLGLGRPEDVVERIGFQVNTRIRLHEWIVPAQKAHKFMTAHDINMMCCGGMERTEALHREYTKQAGLKITKIWSAGDKLSGSVIEVEAPGSDQAEEEA